MHEKIFQQLEFPLILSRAASCALSEEAAAEIREARPLSDPLLAAGLKAQTRAALERLNSGEPEPREAIPSIAAILPRLHVEGAVLELEEACALGLFVERCGRLQGWLAKGADNSSPEFTLSSIIFNTYKGQNDTDSNVQSRENTLSSIIKDTNHGQNVALIPPAALAAALPDCSAVSREVFRVADRDGKLRDLPEFRDIQRRINSLAKDLENAAQRHMGNEETRRMLQSTVPSQRDGRMVLAVRANFRGRIRGIIHEVSSSGQTVFIEPEDVVAKNNELLFERRRLDAEIRRVLREMSARIAEHREALGLFYRGALELEKIRARARHAKETGGVFALDSDAPALRQARHPMLGSAAVPIDFVMDGSVRSVIITGPNTGGKTAALKTVGVFALMNQCGLALPAAFGTALPVFDAVYADIGDEQSLSQSLSTFSAHMTNVAAIAAADTERSLVLLDELGSGTDPEEGSAIAMAILDYLIEKKVHLAATTHHGILKNYGYAREGVENASVDFDSHTLSPTYRIVMGVPGESRAVDIAARNGLDQAIIAGARSYLVEERADVSALIAGLREKRRELDAADRARRDEERRLREERRAADLRELRLRQKDLELKSSGLGKFRELLAESRKTLENLVREVKEGELTREKTLKVKAFLGGLEARANAEDAAVEAEESAIAEERRRLEALYGDAAAETGGRKRARAGQAGEGGAAVPSGDGAALAPGVETLAGDRRGRVLRSAGKGAWVVEIGSLKMTFNEADLRPLPPSAGSGKPSIARFDFAASDAPRAKAELFLIGLRLEEALAALERQIDAAVLGGLHEFAVVHGKGNGVLQKAVHDFLKQQPPVADYYFSRPELGGFGRTEVILRD
ncbi:MAG: Smr/MutS family protein [Treponema sp.]|nr:Smr/MutS family protein [Treponema sp.]